MTKTLINTPAIHGSGVFQKKSPPFKVFSSQQTWLTRVVSIGERERLLFAKNISAAKVEVVDMVLLS